jgi:hypothetical protein
MRHQEMHGVQLMKRLKFPKNSRLGSEMGVFSQELENPGFKVPCCFGFFDSWVCLIGFI